MTSLRSLFLASILVLLSLTEIPAHAAVDLSSPKSAAKSFYEAMGNSDVAAMRDCMLVDGDDQQLLSGAFVDVILAGKKLADAAKDKFGPSGDRLGAGTLNREDASAIDAATQTDNGDDSTLQTNDGRKPLKFHKTSSGWKLVLTDYAGVKADQIPEQIKFLTSLSTALSDAADDIAAGRYPTPDDAMASIQQRLSEVMVKRYKPASTQPAATRPVQQK